MTENIFPNPNEEFPVDGIDNVTYIKPTIKNKNIIVGDFSYFSGQNFEEHVTHHYDFYNDKLIIGKFCQIASGVNFIMNGANHKMNSVSTFPFYILNGWDQNVPPLKEMNIKGDTVVGNDVWIGQNVTILPGVKIGDGAIIGMNSIVGSDIPPYTIVAGNPATTIRKRFDDDFIEFLEQLKWWNLDISTINEIIPALNDKDLLNAKETLKKYLKW